MKIEDSRKKKLIGLLVTALILAIIGAVSVWALTNQNKQESQVTTSGRVQENQAKDPSGDNNTSNNSPDKEIPATSTEEKASPPTITRASISNSNIRVSAIFNEPTTGNCLLELRKDGQETVTVSAGVLVGSSYYTCDGFLVPINKLPQKGDWSVQVFHVAGGSKIGSEVKTISIE